MQAISIVNDIKKYCNFKNPLFRFFLFLSFFGLIATLDLLIPVSNFTHQLNLIGRLIVVIITSLVVFAVIRYRFGLTVANPFNFFISSWIVYLLIHPLESYWYFIIAVIGVAIGKYLFRKNNLPVFNPAAMGIVLTYLVSIVVAALNPSSETLLVSWWGADMNQYTTESIPVLNNLVPLFFLFGFFYFARAFKKIPIIISFFAVFIPTVLIFETFNSDFATAISLIPIIFLNSTPFCACVMLSEPKTSPGFFKQQVLVGAFSGLMLFLFETKLTALPIDPFINTLLVANVATLVLKYRQYGKGRGPAN